MDKYSKMIVAGLLMLIIAASIFFIGSKFSPPQGESEIINGESELVQAEFEVFRAEYYSSFDETGVWIKNISGHDIYNVSSLDLDYPLTIRKHGTIQNEEIFHTGCYGYDTEIMLLYEGKNVTLYFKPEYKDSPS